MNVVKRAISWTITIAIIGSAVVIVLNRQAVYDWWRLRDYEPTAQIAALADNTTMTEYGQRLFYVHNPVLSDRETFSNNCPAYEQSIVLGCYITHQAIYIFDVEDSRLAGIKEVTAAHEMLHAAYDRLSNSDRSDVDGMLEQFFAELDNERIKESVEAYRKRDPLVVPNELHSILGTEVRDLPTELENYYQQYFEDRSKVVALSEQYEAVFTQQRQQIRSLASRIAETEQELASKRVQIEQQQAAIDAEANRLEELRSSDQIAEYNAAVPGYNASVEAYRANIADYNQTISSLNAMVREYNTLAVQQRELFEAIDSSPETI